MIFYDRVGVVCKTKIGTNPVTETFNGIVPALVVPLASGKIVDSGGSLQWTRYQLILKPFSYLIPLNSSSSAPATNGANQILFTYSGHSSLTQEGKVERHLLRGRLHHYEVIVRS